MLKSSYRELIYQKKYCWNIEFYEGVYEVLFKM